MGLKKRSPFVFPVGIHSDSARWTGGGIPVDDEKSNVEMIES